MNSRRGTSSGTAAWPSCLRRRRSDSKFSASSYGQTTGTGAGRPRASGVPICRSASCLDPPTSPSMALSSSAKLPGSREPRRRRDRVLRTIERSERCPDGSGSTGRSARTGLAWVHRSYSAISILRRPRTSNACRSPRLIVLRTLWYERPTRSATSRGVRKSRSWTVREPLCSGIRCHRCPRRLVPHMAPTCRMPPTSAAVGHVGADITFPR